MQVLHIGSHHFEVLPQRALYWPAQHMLLVADLHLGKADTFRQFGIAVPQTVQHSDLQRLHALLTEINPARCVVLGDLVHGSILSADTCNAWNALVHSQPHTHFELVTGNHDRALKQHMLELHAEHTALQVGGVHLTHEPMPRPTLAPAGSLNVHGHIHPALRPDGSRQKLAALVYQSPYLRLPAFSAFTAGVEPIGPCQSLWVFALDGTQAERLI